MRLRIPVLFLFLFLGLAPEAVVAAEPETVTIPFNPPVGEDIRYQVTAEQLFTVPAMPSLSVKTAVTSSLQFKPIYDGGWQVTIVDTRPELSGTDEGKIDLLRALFSTVEPTVLEVQMDASGTPLSVLNVEHYRSKMAKALKEVLADTSLDLDVTAVKTFTAYYSETSLPQLHAILLRNLTFLLGSAGADFPLSETILRRVALPIDALSQQTVVEVDATSSVNRIGDGRVRLETVAVASPTVLRDAIRFHVENELPGLIADASGQADANEDFVVGWSMILERLVVTQRTEVELDVSTGVPVRATLERLGRSEVLDLILETVETITFTRLD